jgi:hypothetical protein
LPYITPEDTTKEKSGIEKKRLTLDLDLPFPRRLKAQAALQDVNMRQYCCAAIETELLKDEGDAASPEVIGRLNLRNRRSRGHFRGTERAPLRHRR